MYSKWEGLVGEKFGECIESIIIILDGFRVNHGSFTKFAQLFAHKLTMTMFANMYGHIYDNYYYIIALS